MQRCSSTARPPVCSPLPRRSCTLEGLGARGRHRHYLQPRPHGTHARGRAPRHPHRRPADARLPRPHRPSSRPPARLPRASIILDVTKRLSHREQNIALIGMPGSGKTRVGEQIALLTGREHIDLDHTLEERLGMPCADYIVERGEAATSASRRRRRCPTSPKRSGLVLSTGGGVVHARRELPAAAPKQPGRDAQPASSTRLAHKGRPYHRARRHRQARRAAHATLPRLGRLHHRLTGCAANTAQALLDALPPAL